MTKNKPKLLRGLMLNEKILENFAFCIAIKYQSDKDYCCDYAKIPRPCHNLAFILEGEGTIISENLTISVKKGDVLFVPKNSTYVSKWSANPNCIFYSIHFNFLPALNPFSEKNVPVQVIPNDDFDKLVSAFKTLQTYQHSKTLSSYLSVSAFYYLCGTLLPNVKIKESVCYESNITPALIYLENNSTKPCSIEKLASLCYLSPSRFFYLFKKKVGCTPITYKNKITIQKISQDLFFYKDKSIERIARENGFESTIYFTRLFKKLTGKTPSQFRKDKMLI